MESHVSKTAKPVAPGGIRFRLRDVSPSLRARRARRAQECARHTMHDTVCAPHYWASMKLTVTCVRMGTWRPSTVKGL